MLAILFKYLKGGPIRIPKFKIGDIVQLKSGGPKMVIQGIQNPNSDETPIYSCCWFTATYECWADDFIEAILEVA